MLPPLSAQFPRSSRMTYSPGMFLAVQWLRLKAPNAGVTRSIPGQGTKIPPCPVAWPKTNKKTEWLASVTERCWWMKTVYSAVERVFWRKAVYPTYFASCPCVNNPHPCSVTPFITVCTQPPLAPVCLYLMVIPTCVTLAPLTLTLVCLVFSWRLSKKLHPKYRFSLMLHLPDSE